MGPLLATAFPAQPNEPRFSCGHEPAPSQFNASTAATRKPRHRRRPSPPPARQLQAVVRPHRNISFFMPMGPLTRGVGVCCQSLSAV